MSNTARMLADPLGVGKMNIEQMLKPVDKRIAVPAGVHAFDWAISHIQQGGNVTRKAWDDGRFLKLIHNPLEGEPRRPQDYYFAIFQMNDDGNTSLEYGFSTELPINKFDLLADDWIEFRLPLTDKMIHEEKVAEQEVHNPNMLASWDYASAEEHDLNWASDMIDKGRRITRKEWCNKDGKFTYLRLVKSEQGVVEVTVTPDDNKIILIGAIEDSDITKHIDGWIEFLPKLR